MTIATVSTSIVSRREDAHVDSITIAVRRGGGLGENRSNGPGRPTTGLLQFAGAVELGAADRSTPSISDSGSCLTVLLP